MLRFFKFHLLTSPLFYIRECLVYHSIIPKMICCCFYWSTSALGKAFCSDCLRQHAEAPHFWWGSTTVWSGAQVVQFWKTWKLRSRPKKNRSSCIAGSMSRIIRNQCHDSWIITEMFNIEISWSQLLFVLDELQKCISKNRGTPKSSILTGFSIINHPFGGTTIFGNTQKNILKILSIEMDQLSPGSHR